MADGALRGRPRSEESRSAILTAANELLRTIGLKQMTVEAVAEASGVGKATIYRWWPSKGMLALEAYLEEMRSKVIPPNTGSGPEDLRRHVEGVVRFYGGEEGRAFAQFIAESQSDPLLAEAFRTRFLAHRRAVVSVIWKRGVDRGEFRSDIDVDVAMDVVFGPIIYRLLAGHGPLSKTLAGQILDAVLGGFLTHPDRDRRQ